MVAWSPHISSAEKRGKVPYPVLRPVSEWSKCEFDKMVELARSGKIRTRGGPGIFNIANALSQKCKGVITNAAYRNKNDLKKEIQRIKDLGGIPVISPSSKPTTHDIKLARELRKKNPKKPVYIITRNDGKFTPLQQFAAFTALAVGGAYVASAYGASAAATAGGQVSTTAGAATKAAVTSGTKAAATGTVSKAATTAGTAAGLSKVVRPKPTKPRVVSELEKAQRTADAIGSLYASVSNAPYTRRPDSNRQNYTAQAGSGSRIYRERGRDAGERGGISWVMLGGAAALVAALMM